MSIRVFPAILLLIAVSAWPGGVAQADEASLQEQLAACGSLRDPEPRLACFDRLLVEPGTTEVTANAGLSPGERLSELSRMNLFWELDDRSHSGRGRIRSYEPLLALPLRWSSSPNERPVSPTTIAVEAVPLDSIEAFFRLSLRTKLWDNPIGDNGDVWVAYAQDAYWQAYNGSQSSPFRETNYMPEVFSVWRVNLSLGEQWRWRMLGLGLKHQSNGRGSTLGISRSWNRLYANFGFEGPSTEVYLRPWIRVMTEDEDDNPDVEDFLGYGDLRIIHHLNQSRVELTGRLNPSTGKGMLRAGYHFPLVGDLHGYFEVFSGYGESLLDYNHKQTTISAGVSMFQF